MNPRRTSLRATSSFTSQSSDASSELSELDSAVFDGLSIAALATQEPSGPPVKKRKLRATKTWIYNIPPAEGEPERDEKNRRIFRCRPCKGKWQEAVTTNIRRHLWDKHGIKIEEDKSLVKQSTKQHIRHLLVKQGELSAKKEDDRERDILKNAIQPNLVREALAQLIVMRNLPFNAVK
jgi:hypothetical protein